MTSMLVDLCHWAFTYAKSLLKSNAKATLALCNPYNPVEMKGSRKAAEPVILDLFLNPTNQPVLLTDHSPTVGTKWTPFMVEPDGIPQVASNNGGYILGDSQRFRSAGVMTLPNPFPLDSPITIISTLTRPYLAVPALEMSYKMVLMNSASLNGLMFQITSSPLLEPPGMILLFEMANGSTPKELGSFKLPEALPTTAPVTAQCTWSGDGTCSLVLSWSTGPSFSFSPISYWCSGKTDQAPGSMQIDTFMLQLESDNPIHSLHVQSLQVV